MKKLNWAAVAAVVLLVASPAHATPVLEFSSSQTSGFPADVSAGWEFTTNEAVTVTALDAFNTNGPGAGMVRLYNTAGDILASATLSSADAQEGAPIPFYTQPIVPITLAANTNYFIAEDVAAFAGGTGTLVEFAAIDVTTDPSITYVGGVVSAGFAGTPTTNVAGGDPAFFGPNFDIAVPEPASIALLLAGLGGLGAIRRKRIR